MLSDEACFTVCSFVQEIDLDDDAPSDEGGVAPPPPATVNPEEIDLDAEDPMFKPLQI